MSIRFIAASISLLAVAFAGCTSEVPAVEPIDLRAVYDRTDRDFDSAVMFRPDDLYADLPAFTMAPLLVVENGDSGLPAPEVAFERTGDGWIYRWTDPMTGRDQGLRLTLGDDGFPLAYEVLNDSSGVRLMFVDIGLEEAALETFGKPLPERRYAVERSVDESPDVVVGGLFEPGSTPLGPFVYLWAESHDVNVVLCRCMAPRVYDIVDSIPYDLVAGAAGETGGVPLDETLRLP